MSIEANDQWPVNVPRDRDTPPLISSGDIPQASLEEAVARCQSTEPRAGPAQAILTRALADRPVIEDFRPFAESIEWQLGGQYLRERGNKAFLGDARPVPYLINND